MPIINFSAKAKSQSNCRTHVTARNFSMIIDEPPIIGGTDEGANPIEYFFAGLCGCINVLGNIIAKEMNINLKSLEIEIDGDLDTDVLWGKSKDKRAGFEIIRVKVKPDCDADVETLAVWLKQVEQRCPVSDNIIHSTPVDYKIIDN